MSDFKSKLPDLKEVANITTKLFRDLTNSVSEIIADYKEKHFKEPEEKESTTTTTATPKKPEAKIKTSVDIKTKTAPKKKVTPKKKANPTGPSSKA